MGLISEGMCVYVCLHVGVSVCTWGQVTSEGVCARMYGCVHISAGNLRRCMCVSMWVCAHEYRWCTETWGDKSRTGVTGCCDTWHRCWQPKLRYSVRTANALSHWVIFPAPSPIFKVTQHVHWRVPICSRCIWLNNEKSFPCVPVA